MSNASSLPRARSGKWYLTLAVSAASAIEGGLFARVGEEARVFAFGDDSPVPAGSTVIAEVEYLGGPTGGEFRLVRLLASSTTPFIDAAPGDVPEPTDEG